MFAPIEPAWYTTSWWLVWFVRERMFFAFDILPCYGKVVPVILQWASRTCYKYTWNAALHKPYINDNFVFDVLFQSLASEISVSIASASA
jgi:hypothetical protein